MRDGDFINQQGWMPDSINIILPKLAEHLVELSNPQKDHVVLDLASGSGTCAIRFAREAGTVYAVDNNKAQLKLCGEQAKKKGLNNVELIHKDLYELSFDDVKFDLISGIGAISNLRNPVCALQTAKQFLKPNGKIVLGDYFVPETIQELYGVLTSFMYGTRRHLIGYYQLMDILYESGFQVETLRPIRWVHPLSRHLREILERRDKKWEEKDQACLNEARDRYLQAFLDADGPTKKALNLHKKDGEWHFTFNCFALVAKPFEKDKGLEWEYFDTSVEMNNKRNPQTSSGASDPQSASL